MRLIHLTDLHLTSLNDESFWRLSGKRRLGYLSWTRHRRLIHRPAVLERLVDAVRAEDPDQILISGDLVQLGLPREIAAARACLERIGPPESVTLVPGNHDLYASDSWDAVREHWGEYLHLGSTAAERTTDYPLRRELGEIDVIGLSSACPTRAFMASGRLGSGQLDRLAALLAASSGRFSCLLLHHPPGPGMVAPRKALADADALAKMIREGPVQLVLHGHVHLNCEHKLGDSVVYGTASASSASAAAPASYRCIDVEGGRDGWRVQMCLKSLVASGALETVAESSLSFERWREPSAFGAKR